MDQPTVNGPIRYPDQVMPPRSSDHLEYVPLQHHSVTESMEAKLKRLRPSHSEERSTAPAFDAGVPDGIQAQCESASKPRTHNILTRSTLQWCAASGEDHTPKQSHPSTFWLPSLGGHPRTALLAGDAASVDDLIQVHPHGRYVTSAGTFLLHRGIRQSSTTEARAPSV